MGNLFSKKLTIKDKLLNLENNIIKTQYTLSTLKRSTYSYSILLFTLFLIPLSSYLSYLFRTTLILCVTIVFSVCWFYALRTITNKRIQYTERKLEGLQEERRILIEQCKNDVNFSTTKAFIDKYEEEESRSTFFRQLQKKKKSAMDSVTDFVLGNDPTRMNALICKKCGVHNGLIDPKNGEIDYFVCYNCEYKNMRASQ